MSSHPGAGSDARVRRARLDLFASRYALRGRSAPYLCTHTEALSLGGSPSRFRSIRPAAERKLQLLDIAWCLDSEIVRERRAVSPDTALRLARYFGSSPEFRMDLQTAYDLKIAAQAAGEAIAAIARRAA